MKYFLNMKLNYRSRKFLFLFTVTLLEIEEFTILAEDGRIYDYWKPGTGYKRNDTLRDEVTEFLKPPVSRSEGAVIIFGYEAGLDYAALVKLFRGPENVPEWFPAYIVDLKQTVDEINAGFKLDEVDYSVQEDSDFPFRPEVENTSGYAKWVERLYYYLTNLTH